jgi:hypothetical protein
MVGVGLLSECNLLSENPAPCRNFRQYHSCLNDIALSQIASKSAALWNIFFFQVIGTALAL